MALYSPKIYKSVIKGILTAQETSSCAYRVEIVSNECGEHNCQQDYVTIDGADRTDASESMPGDEKLFGFGSGMKLIVNFALYRMIEGWEQVHEDKNIRWMMRNAWNKPAFRLYNELRSYRGLQQWKQPRNRTPSVVQLMTHSHAFPSHQRGLFGPDGTFLMTEETFGETFADLVDAAPQTANKSYCYSNWNAILLGLIVKHAAGQPLADALKRIVLDHCHMSNTILDRESYERKRGQIAQPYVGTAEIGSVASSIVSFLDDDAALAVGGGFSCVEDMCRLLKTILKPLLDEDQEVIKKLFTAPEKIDNNGVRYWCFPIGLYADLDSEATGSESFERLPGSTMYKLGRYAGVSVLAISKAGAVRGYACHFYMVPSQALVLAVMTNTSGIADSSQTIAQYILQETVNLSPRLAKVEDKAAEIHVKNRNVLMQKASCHRPGLELSMGLREELQGCFTEVVTRQRIIIESADDDQLCVYVAEGVTRQPRHTAKMRLVKIAEKLLAFSPFPETLAPDSYHAWRDFALEIQTDNGRVCALKKIDSGGNTDQLGNKQAAFKELYRRQDGWSWSGIDPWELGSGP